MEKYYIKSRHDISEDSYQYGIGKMTNYYEMNGIVEADEALDALEKYGKQVLGYDYDGYEINTDDDLLYCDILVNEDCMEATAEQIRLWEKGELKLYNDHIQFEISIMQRITNLE
jgi:hypothetical protein